MRAIEMKAKEKPYENIIRLQKNPEIDEIYDIELFSLDKLKKYNSFECHFVLYPYSRKICSKNMSFFPFEEYVKDISVHQRSAYTKMSSPLNNLFGLFLGFVITMVFFFFKPDDLFSVESIVSVFGAYIIGKEVWDDIENILINLSKEWRIRYQENYYLYKLEKHTTLTYYSYLAKKQRYGKSSPLPEKIDFIEKSNSQTVRMFFNVKDLESFQDPTAHIFSVHIDPSLLEDFRKEGFLFGVKLSFNKKFLGIRRCREFFQSINGKSKGCLNEKGEWIENGIFYRKTCIWGKIKCFLKKGIICDENLLKF